MPRPLDTGTYTLDGETVAELSEDRLARVRNRKIGFIFQSYYLMPRTTIADNVAQPLIYRGLAPAIRRERAHAALARVGLEARLLHKPNELSGGQRQRVAIARALVGRPEVLLADEPTGNLDSTTAREIMGVFGDLHRDGMTIIIVTHDAAVAQHCRRVVRLHDGRIVEDRERMSDVAPRHAPNGRRPPGFYAVQECLRSAGASAPRHAQLSPCSASYGSSVICIVCCCRGSALVMNEFRFGACADSVETSREDG